MKMRVRATSVISAAPRAFSAAAEVAGLPDWAEEIAAANDGAPRFEPTQGEAGLVAVLTRPPEARR